jgi:hypothetical protein
MKSLINTVIIICCLGFIIAESSCDNGPDFGNVIIIIKSSWKLLDSKKSWHSIAN